MTLLDVQQQNLAADTAAPSAKPDFMPPAGPHDRPELTNFDACPGCGSFPSQTQTGGEIDPGAG
ncbi:MAG TPA: hypothetical protein VMU18_08570 [Rhodoblastus sp.]|nr:hypothetical protein [Rhodoblastus sp.]